MSEPIKVGDVCEILGPLRAEPVCLAAYAGMDCTICAGPFQGCRFESGTYYEVTAYDGRELSIDRINLRKKRPPADCSTWDQVQADTNWRPKKQTVLA